MPLIAVNDLPTYQRLDDEGYEVLDPVRAQHQDIRELHIGLFNMMPDAALAATERQFFRLMATSNRIVQIHMHPFAPPSMQRSDEARDYIDRYYERFDDIREQGLDGLIISGANPAEANLQDESFWPDLLELVEWAGENVASTLCSCLATHALIEHFHGIRRRPLPEKRWGVYDHRVTSRAHPLTRNINSRMAMIHSRWNEMRAEDFASADLPVLIDSELAGVHLATSRDGLRYVYMQGHPEYDDMSLLKELKREVQRWFAGERDDWPPLPHDYLNRRGGAILEEYRARAEAARSAGKGLPDFPEALLMDGVDNTWRDSAKTMTANWIGLIYRYTNLDRRLRYMDGVDPDWPLGDEFRP